MAKGQMRSNREKKKPKQDKNKKKGPAPKPPRRSPGCTAKPNPGRTRTSMARSTRASGRGGWSRGEVI